jgi:CubicO group peptidase (beta-lactamase class C family)
VPPEVEAPRVQRVVFDSASAETKVGCHVYTPRAYDAEPDRRFPVLYWLHGWKGVPGRATVGGVAPMAARFDAAIDAGKIPPLLVVFANGMDSLWVDSKDGRMPMESVVVKDLVPHIDSAFRTIASREGRIVEGFSMGGYGAARFGFKYPDLFGAVSILAGGPLQQVFTNSPRVGARGRERVMRDLFGDDPAHFTAQSPWDLAGRNVAALTSGATRVRMVIGARDEMLENIRTFEDRLQSLRIPHEYVEVPGAGHDTMRVIEGLGDSFWAFHRAAVGRPGTAPAAPPPASAGLEAARRYSEANGGQAMVVMHDGRIVFEGYGHGGGADRRQTLASGTKSFVGLAAVAAVDDGLIRLDDKACESLTEWMADPLKSQITYRQLLTLTSGLTPGERGSAIRSPGWKDIVAKPMTGKPGERFEYGAYHLCAFAEALQRRLTNETFEAYLSRRILRPLGITLEWRMPCADGNPQVGGGGAMTARDWARLGEFMRLGGQWNGKQIIRNELLADCLRGTKQNPAYGLTWWLKEPVPDAILRDVPILQRDMGDIVKSDRLPEDLFLAAGAGKQRLYVIPSMKLVVVRQGSLLGSRGFSDATFLDLLDFD